jgi:ribosomal protein S18 acetylase RimI-like enzyme
VSPGAAGLLVRRLAPPDAAAYRALMLGGYAGDPEAFTATVGERAALPLAFWEARLACGDTADEVVFGALADGQLVGALGLAFERRPKLRHKARLFGMYVAPQARRRGLGRLLVEAALAAARGRGGIVQVRLTVTDGNPAPQGLYARCGFRTFGSEPLAVLAAGGFADQIHMWRPLSPED